MTFEGAAVLGWVQTVRRSGAENRLSFQVLEDQWLAFGEYQNLQAVAPPFRATR